MKHLLFVMMLLCGACTHAQEGWNVSQKKKGYGMEKRSVIYLAGMYDTEWGQDTAKPFIMENTKLMKEYHAVSDR